VDRFPATQPVSASAEILSASTCAIWIRPDRERKEEQALDRLKTELARPFAAHESARKPLTRLAAPDRENSPLIRRKSKARRSRAKQRLHGLLG